MKPHIVAIIQARRASSRLPDKVLLDINGKPMLVRVVERTHLARFVNEVVVATTEDPFDDPVEELCVTNQFTCFRGSNLDVLDRYYQAASIHHADIIVRITADCPVIDPSIIDMTIAGLFGMKNDVGMDFSTLSEINSLAPQYDFAANRLPPPWKRTYPIGLDTEVCTYPVLETAWREAELPHQREHVMPFFYEQPDRFRVLHVTHEPDLGDLRWTVDTPEDLELLRQIYNRFPDRNDFTWLEILDLFNKEPVLALINAGVEHKHYRQVDIRQENNFDKKLPLTS